VKLFVLLSALRFVFAFAPYQPQVLYDDLNHPFALSSPPQRIVSLAPNITEILFSLGLGNKVVGVTRYCDYPPQVLEIEKIGGLIDPNLEKIQALRPDLIVAFRGNPLRLLNKLRSLHFPVFVLDTGKSLEDIFLTIEKIGRLTRSEEQATSLIQALKKEYEGVQQALQAVTLTPKVFLSLPGQGLWTCGQESYLNDLIVKAKGINIAGQVHEKWLHLNREVFIHENPEVIIIMAKNQKGFSRVEKWFLTQPHLKTVTAVKKNQIFFLDENTASRFGPRLVDAYVELAHLLHPRLFQQEG
jgi:iron complex transport system substrate-binding protein